jgi:D-alanyl-D-alanine carboxypeptidase
MRLAFVFGAACLLLSACGGASRQAQRPVLQKELDSLVTGQFRVAPGAAAYVSGPHGTWQGSAGMADVAQHVAMTANVPSRVGSVSKLWTAVVVMKLAEQGKLKLNDTVERWLPGAFPYGKRITIRELLNHTSGMVDDNDIEARPSYWLGQIHSPAIRRQLLKVETVLAKNPAATVAPQAEMRVAAALPLLFRPGSEYHYSNIGYKTVAAIAERAGHSRLAALYHRFIIDPLKLTSAGYDPTATITGPHAVGYIVGRGGKARPSNGIGDGTLAASGGIVVNANDEARFLIALVRRQIVSKPYLRQIETAGLDSYGLGTAVTTLCGQRVLSHGGATHSYMAEVAVNTEGSRVAVLLINGRTYNSWGDYFPVQTLNKLFCAS